MHEAHAMANAPTTTAAPASAISTSPLAPNAAEAPFPLLPVVVVEDAAMPEFVGAEGAVGADYMRTRGHQ